MDQATIDLIVKFLPVIAAVLGSVATLITTYLLRNSGILTVNVNSVTITRYGRDGMGGNQEKKTLEGVVNVDCSFEVDFYNSSETPKSLRALTIELLPRNTRKSYPLTIYMPRKVDNPTITYAPIMPVEIHILNFPSKEMLHHRLSVGFPPEKINQLQGKVDFFFRGKFPSGKTFRKKLYTEEF